MDYKPTHVIMRSADLQPRPNNAHIRTMEYIHVDTCLPVLDTLGEGHELCVKVPVRHPRGDYTGWWLGFGPRGNAGITYGFATDVSMPHLTED